MMKYLDQSKRVFSVFKERLDGLSFGSYAAEVSYYILLAVIPILLAFSNLIVLLPYSYEEVIRFLRTSLPGQVARPLIPMIQQYFETASTTWVPIGLALALWPASNVFNALQRMLNEIYLVKSKRHFFVQRLFAYLFTLLSVLVILVSTFIFTFGEQLLLWLDQNLKWDFNFLAAWIKGGSWGSLLFLFIFLVMIYTYLPHHNLKFSKAIPGSLFSLIGFTLLGKLFGTIIQFNKSLNSNTALGAIIVVMFWIYLNCMIFFVGAYVNVVAIDLRNLNKEKIRSLD
ncbi:YihY/virulence factor BrkB family protein [Facklamia miroungae]|uniref:Membrane protein n=1 Tax=Facklamia miroungae TaxID=120956 RepID=A0A1G7PTG4_9LACT|nr:YihY/virulence factor BrkB family protein [Facklamia miroungae]NKZ28822.1 YihY/virulence factor BrkB family protein [Facklamia miroungae]SDF89538.1 membrane protein [Facklamia miroungae]